MRKSFTSWLSRGGSCCFEAKAVAFRLTSSPMLSSVGVSQAGAELRRMVTTGLRERDVRARCKSASLREAGWNEPDESQIPMGARDRDVPAIRDIGLDGARGPQMGNHRYVEAGRIVKRRESCRGLRRLSVCFGRSVYRTVDQVYDFTKIDCIITIPAGLITFIVQGFFAERAWKVS